jgi:DNA-binding response OmpR family regulator
MRNFNLYRTLEINALICCQDNLFLPTMTRVLRHWGVQTDITADSEYALELIAEKRLDAIVIDWQEIADLGEFLQKIRNSRLNQEAVKVVIARDLMDIRQAFSAGIQFLIHKPASVVQISGCLEAMQGAILKQRRRGHRESFRISTDLSIRKCSLQGAMIVNVSIDGLGLLLNTRTCRMSAELSTGNEIEFAFRLPETDELIVGIGIIKWISRHGDAGVEFREASVGTQRPKPNAGVQFQLLSDTDTVKIERWIGERFDRFVEKLRESMKTGCA